MIFPHGIPVTVLPFEAGTQDAHGNPVDAWGSGTVWPGCAIDSLSAEPVEPGRDVVVDVGKVYGPFDMVVSARDRVIIRGVMWDVVGEVWREQNPFTGTQFGCWFGIRKVAG